jgi:hypothetical protein
MPISGTVKLDIAPSRELRDQMRKHKGWRVKVGILGNKAERQEPKAQAFYRVVLSTLGKKPKDPVNNPALGLWHEFGIKSTNLPARSWLRMPVLLFLKSKVEHEGPRIWRFIVAKRGYREALARLGVLAESIIHSAFETGGFGNWPALKKRTIKRKGSSAILIDSAQFRKAVSSAVVNGGAP